MNSVALGFNALSAAITVSSVVLVMLVLLFGLIRKPAKVHAGLVVTLISAVLALVTALLFKGLAASAVWNIISVIASQNSDAAEFMAVLKETPNFYGYAGGVLVALVTPAIFGFSFFFNKLFLMLFNALFAKLFRKNAPQGNLKWVVKIGVGLINGLLILMLITVPTISTLDIAGTIAGNESVAALAEKFGDGNDVAELFISVKKLEKNPMIRLSSAIGGKKLSDVLSTVKFGDEKKPVSRQLDRDLDVISATYDLAEAASDGIDAVFSADFSSSLKNLSSALKDDPALTAAIADVVSAAGESLKKNGSVGGIEFDLPDDPAIKTITDAVFGTLANIDEKNLTETFDGLAGVIDTLDKTGAADKLKGDTPDVLGALATPGAVSGTLSSLGGNEVLQPLADALTKTAVSSVTDMLGVDGKTAQDLLNSTSLDLKNMTDEKARDVEKMISSAGKVVESVSDKAGSDVLKNVDTDALQDMLDAIDGSGLIKGGSDKLLDAVIGSDAMKDTGFIDDKTLEQIKENGSANIGNTLGTAQNAVSIVEELTSDKPDKENVKDNLEWLLENMDDTGAGFVKDQLTTDKLTTFGVNPIAAPGVSTLITNLLDEIVAAEADSSVNTEAETEALTNLYTFGINSMDTVNKGNIFGSGEGQTSAKTLVDTILASRVTSNALNKTAAPDGKLVNDPLGCNIELSNADKAELVSAINEGLKSSIGTPALEETQSTVLSIAALFGIAGTVDSNYKFIAK